LFSLAQKGVSKEREQNMNGNGQLIERLASSEIFHDYERAFTETTGLPLALRGVETWQLPHHGKRNETPFCAIMSETSKTCAACLQTQEALAKSATDRPATITCKYGLCETAAPIKLGGQTIGFLQTGQVLDRKATAASCDRAITRARELGINLDNERARKAYFDTPVMPAKKLDSTAKLLSIFADHLSIKSNEIAMHQASAEPPVIARARKYIEEHYMEDLSLGMVAKAMNTSLFYFCKLFSKAAGMPFTEFVSRTRVEKAKNLLLNRNLRVSEIVYEVGFQSLTHFNRVFRRIVGESPTDYRQHLSLA
jgi:AraC-like DNA-binding protein/ligand-binding sensor protein